MDVRADTNETVNESSVRKYFAAEETKTLLPLAFERIDAFYRHIQEKGWLALWRASHKAKFSGWYVGGRLNQAGENQKFTTAEANDYGNLATHVLNLVTGSKSQPEAQAKNLDHASQRQTAIAQGLAETIATDKGLEKSRQAVTSMGLLYGEGWGLSTWDPLAGDVFVPQIDPATGVESPVNTGDYQHVALHPVDVVRDVSKKASTGHRWYITRRYENRYDLMALYPEIAQDIDGVPSAVDELEKYPRLLQNERAGYGIQSDDVVVWTFWHERCPALPDGRQVDMLGPDVALKDGPLEYDGIPLRRWAADDTEGTPFGYSLFFDLLALQQWIDALASAMATRSTSFAVPDVWFPEGSSPTRKIMEGLGILEGGQVKPEVMDWLQTGGLKELQNVFATVRGLMATYSGINNVARGQPEGGVTAASALALLEARAIQFVALSQKADIDFMSGTYTDALRIYQRFPSAPFLVRIVGAANRHRVESFMSSDLDQIDGFVIKAGNPLQSTTAGRVQLVEGMKALGISMTQQQYMSVMTTGRLDPVTEGPQKEIELIKAENERLSEGQPVIACIADNHALHIQEHKVVIADPETRQPENQAVLQAVLSHIQEHEQQWQEATVTRPALLAASQPPQQPAPMPMPPPGAMPPPGPGASPGGPPGKPPNAAGPMAESLPGANPLPVHQAQPAKSPVTGQRAPLALPS